MSRLEFNPHKISLKILKEIVRVLLEIITEREAEQTAKQNNL